MKGVCDVGCNQFEDEVYDEERLLHCWEEDCAERNYGAFDGDSGGDGRKLVQPLE
jgi:hypothetical protein